MVCQDSAGHRKVSSFDGTIESVTKVNVEREAQSSLPACQEGGFFIEHVEPEAQSGLPASRRKRVVFSSSWSDAVLRCFLGLAFDSSKLSGSGKKLRHQASATCQYRYGKKNITFFQLTACQN